MTTYKTLFMLILSLILPAFLMVDSNAGSLPGEVVVYVDLDGDGFDDNLPDSNEDGIPDVFEASKIKAHIDNVNEGVDILTEIGADPLNLPSVSSGEQFSARQLAIRGLESCRSDFEADFGSGLGIGIAIGGGACAGGICF